MKLMHDSTPTPRQITRRIGSDTATVEHVLELVRAGRKTGTFTLPWLAERGAEELAGLGDTLVLTDFAGRPALVLRITTVSRLAWGTITAADTVVDGPGLQDLASWRAFHEPYWNMRLAPFGLVVSEHMPVHAERFELIGLPPRHAAAVPFT
jgi:uncharacterized protein YhfF